MLCFQMTDFSRIQGDDGVFLADNINLNQSGTIKAVEMDDFI